MYFAESLAGTFNRGRKAERHMYAREQNLAYLQKYVEII